ncbi:MAG: HAMP domain-containing protein, partial [Parvularculaceae bacterium]|nr:HAMP domain-containing protein [Parvularculaceae bacterium]
SLSGETLPLPPSSQLKPKVSTDGSPSSAPFGFVEPEQMGAYFIILPLGSGEYGYLIGYRREVPRIADGLLAVRDFRDENRLLQRRARQIGSASNYGFLLLSVVLLLAALWIGLSVANAVVNPIRRLATAADRVSSGDLQSRVEVRQRDGELGDLGHSFNQMTERLAAQREDLIAAGEDAENRRRFIETMLAAIPAGVISVSREGDIGLANPSAAIILGQEPGDLVGRPLTAVIPPASPLLDVVRNTGKSMRESVEWSRASDVRSLVIEISPEAERGEDGAGYVITIEDITELLTAQRTAAWGDVARRIAHEIKNPLTPIQLSAERLRRRYAKDLEGRDREIFDQCTETIIRHVGDIGRMVTEFSSFARMPEPIMTENDLREIAREALFPFTVAHPAVAFDSTLPEAAVPVLCDNRLIVQALTNMIKNAVESIEENATVVSGRIEVEVAAERTGARIEVRDNGLGLPDKLRHRLTEPYMTTRAKGTGLGLAIVRKAVEDHDGSFSITDREGGGAVASLFLPTLQKEPEAAERDISATVREEESAFHGH